MTGRIWAAEAAWAEAGFNDGRPDGSGTSIRLPLGAFKHVVGCVRSHLGSCCLLYKRFGAPAPDAGHSAEATSSSACVLTCLLKWRRQLHSVQHCIPCLFGWCCCSSRHTRLRLTASACDRGVHDITLMLLLLHVMQIATRMYGYPSRPNNDEDYMQLLPIFDMANCADQGTS